MDLEHERSEFNYAEKSLNLMQQSKNFELVKKNEGAFIITSLTHVCVWHDAASQKILHAYHLECMLEDNQISDFYDLFRS